MYNLQDYNPEEIKTPEAAAATTTEITTDELIQIPTVEAPKEIIAAPEELKDAKAELSETEKKDLASRNAAMYVNLIDLIVSRGCMLLTGAEVDRYKLTKSEKEEYTKVSADYFYTINAQVSPALVFMVSTLTIFSSILFRAYGDFKAKTQKEKADAERKQKEAKAKAEAEAEQLNRDERERTAAATATAELKQPKEIKLETPAKKTPKIYKEEIPEAKNARSNFEIYSIEDKKTDSKTWNDNLIGKYKRSQTNDRWTYEECLKANDNTPSEFCIRYITQHREAHKAEGKEIKESWKNINLELRRILKNLPSQLN